MIYDEIEKAVSNKLITDFNLSTDEILTQSEIPDDDLDFFCRQTWTYGTIAQSSNQNINELAILNIEIYERKNNTENKISSLIHDLRYYICKNFSLFNGSDSRAKMNGIYIVKNTNDADWISYTIGIRFRIYKDN